MTPTPFRHIGSTTVEPKLTLPIGLTDLFPSGGIMIKLLLILIIIMDLMILFTSCQSPTLPAVTTRFALSFCNGYGDLVGDFILTCYPKETKL